MLSETGEFVNPYRYAGYEYIEELKLYDLKARHYDPDTGRFLSEDPYFDLGNRIIGVYEINVPSVHSIIQANNLYAYCGGNPIIFFDPFGLAPTTKEAAAMAEHIYSWDQYSDYDDRVVSGWRLIDVWRGQSSMKMGIYIREGDDWKNPSEYVVVFKGTDNLQNWVENALAYTTDLSLDMWDSINKSREFVDMKSDYEITFVGHSKGGGEAIAAATYNNKNAITFNAANFDFGKYNLIEKNKTGIKNYYVEGEALYSTIGAARFGTTMPFLPTQEWMVDTVIDINIFGWQAIYHQVKIPNPIGNHMMSAVKKGL